MLAAPSQVAALLCRCCQLLAGTLRVPKGHAAIHRELEGARMPLGRAQRIFQGVLSSSFIRCPHSSLYPCAVQPSGTCTQKVHKVQVCGFSGTNDSRWLLPFSVEAQEAAGKATKATDGKNVLTLLQPGKLTVTQLPPQAQNMQSKQDAAAHLLPGSCAQQVLELAVKERVDALIDAGESRSPIGDW